MCCVVSLGCCGDCCGRGAGACGRYRHCKGRSKHCCGKPCGTSHMSDLGNQLDVRKVRISATMVRQYQIPGYGDLMDHFPALIPNFLSAKAKHWVMVNYFAGKDGKKIEGRADEKIGQDEASMLSVPMRSGLTLVMRCTNDTCLDDRCQAVGRWNQDWR